MKVLLTFLWLVLFCQVFTRTAEEWKSRVIYQIITDRFAQTDGDTSPCLNLRKYCGGTFKGVKNNLDYIQDLGFNAIWISPVFTNIPDGYHGYWATNLYGTEEDLKELIEACHERDIWVMADITANHMGFVENHNFSMVVPFNDKKIIILNLNCALKLNLQIMKAWKFVGCMDCPILIKLIIL